MERQFLVILSLCLLAGCQITSVSTPVEINDELTPTLAVDEIKQPFQEEPSKNIWEYIVNKSLQDSEIVINDQALLFMNNHIKDIDKFNDYLNKSYYFIYYVVQELEAADLPVELAFIPFIESNYDPFSISPSGAVGLWQFMPKTGRLFNLEKTWWSEDRHDPYRSTHAAIGYFKYLFERFDNDIYLALAAYNAGPTNVNKWIKLYGDPREKNINFINWIESIPFKETRNYVQRVIENYVVYQKVIIDIKMKNIKNINELMQDESQ